MIEGTLSDRLKSLGVQLGAHDLPPPRPRLRYPIEQVLPGSFRATASGDVFVVETDYAADYQHGSCSLQISAPLDLVARWAREPRVARLDGPGFVFLDTETTGLAGGTGTYPFLVGLGRYAGQGFRVAQFFMREPIEEAALLEALTESFSPHTALVTFNGKAFDAPLLNTRYVFGRMASPLTDLAHVDLLPLARRLWRSRLPSRALGALETHILGAVRTQHDVPGWLIPGLYFDYLRTGDARPLQGVFYHNAMDIVALAALLNHVARVLADPLHAGIEHGLDLIDLGCLFEDLGEPHTAAHLFRSGLEHDLPAETREQTMRRLALLQRRRGCVDEAVAVWQQAADAQHVYAHVELAKHCEHQLRDYDQAARWTQTAIDLVTASGLSRHQRARWLADLTHRLGRLQRKISRTQAGVP